MLTPEYLQEITDKSESLAAGLKEYIIKRIVRSIMVACSEERSLRFPRRICGIYKHCRSLTNFWRIL